ncbi:MAG: DUF4160 domain-containing protein [Candidatus Fermentibacteria bacterium]|nr:DUF4160 domain-containing protein [Candidatus Fermentibacteria bacterium]
MHIHVRCSDGEVKFWPAPEIELAKNYKLSRSQIHAIEKIIEEHYEQIANSWGEHFGN